MGMGINGGAGLVVGVLTGSGTKQQLLDTGAHVVLPNIGHLEDLLRCLPPREVAPSSTTVVSVESDASIDEMRNEEETAASLLVSMKSKDPDSLPLKAGKEQTGDNDDLMFQFFLE
eukprot:scaffold39867_cov222-Skeletonema_dohrnii-CCMP3373.AAC.2